MRFNLFKSGRSYALLLLSYLLLSTLSAQEKSIPVKGVVQNNNGDLLPGVSVVIRNTTTNFTSGTTTDSTGVFNFPRVLPGGPYSFSFSMEGYESQVLSGYQIKHDISLSLVVKMKERLGILEQVVVVGYGTQKKRAVTGSVASIGFEQFKDRSSSNVMQSIEGMVAGVNISTTQGAPGFGPTIRVRGINSITAGTNPLYVVDGMALENFDLNVINPQDIQSVEILKDAASAAIYGSRGANGVIIVTTRLGKAGKPQVNIGYERGLQQVVRRVDVMDAQEWIKYYIAARNNAWVASGPGRSASDPNSVRGGNKTYLIPPDFLTNPQQFGKGTDWQDVLFRTAPSNNIQASVSGGTDKAQYLFSAGYLDQDAVIIDNFYKRLSLRVNIKQKVTEKVTTGLNLSITGAHSRTDGVEGKSDVVSLALQNDPIFPIYNENGNLGYLDPNSTWNRFSAYGVQLWHPYSLIKYADKSNKVYNVLAGGFIEYKPFNDLTFRSSANAILTQRNYSWFWHTNAGYGYSSLLPADARYNTYNGLNWLTENSLSYDKKIGKHTLGVLAAYTAQKQRSDTSQQRSTGFPNDLVTTLNAAGTYSQSITTAGDWSLLSWLSRISYSFDNKYFLNATLRRDGSSRFGQHSRWGYFPSVSAGWLVSDEKFMQSAKAINMLKLRVSYGTTGNNQIPNYGPVSLLEGTKYAYSDNVVNGIKVSTIANPDLRWEKTSQFNLGVDVAFFNNRINLTTEFYNSITRDLLLNVPVPITTGFASQLTNIGKLRNRGVELLISSKNIVHKNFRWNTDFNISANRNKVLQLGPNNAPVIVEEWGARFVTEVGKPISNYVGYIFDGVYNNQAEIDKGPKYASNIVVTPGDPRVRDVTGEGNITADDRTTLGNSQPDFTAGLVNTFVYKNVEFSFMLHGVFGNEIVNQQTRYNKFWNDSRNAYGAVNNYWKSEQDPGDGKIFKPNAEYKGMQTQFSSYWIENGTFVRIKNIRLSYSFPQGITARTPFKSMRVYVNAENVHVFSKYIGYDPENSTYSTGTDAASSNTTFPPGLMMGADYGSYPIPLTITFGVKLDL
jgi:TonB-linked SusC/RagA family outer membrane protein